MAEYLFSVYLFLSISCLVIKEAVHLKKHNLYEEINLPSESVSSLSDLKTPVESAQASPARGPAPNLMDESDAGLGSNEVFLTEKLHQEEEYDEARKTEEEGIIISDFGGSESCPKILTVVEGVFPITNASEITIKQRTAEEEELPIHDDVNEIRNLLTLTVELKEYEQSTNKEQDLQECGMSNSKEEVQEKSKEDHQTGDLQKPFSPTVKADDTNIVSSSGETSIIIHQDASETSEKQSPSDISREELNTEPNIAHPDEKNDGTYDQSQTEPSTESDQSDQSKIDPSPHDVVSEEQKSQTEHAEGEQPDQIKEEFSSLHTFPKEDHSQMGQCIKADSQEAELFLLQSVQRETEISPFLSCSVETQECMLHTESLNTEAPPLLVSLEVKETEANNVVSMDSENVTFDQGGDSEQAGESLLEMDAADIIKSDES